MGFPRPKWFTVEELAREWEVSSDYIQRLIDSFELIASKRYTCPGFELPDQWIDLTLERRRTRTKEFFSSNWIHEGTYIKLKEVERFEKEHDLTVSGVQGDRQPESQTSETDTELVKRLKEEGLKQEEIAQKLRKVFPAITPHRIGVLLTKRPGEDLTPDAYRKRGKKLLGMPSKKNASK